MSERVRGNVINVHALGAAVRLEDGRLVSVPLVDVNKNRASYTRALGNQDDAAVRSRRTLRSASDNAC